MRSAAPKQWVGAINEHYLRRIGLSFVPDKILVT